MWEWINLNAAGIQAVGSVIAVFIAIGVAWLSHLLDVRRSEEAIRQDEVRILETVASVMINAMNLIQTAKESICDGDGGSILGYRMEVYDSAAFENATEALREIPIAHLPDYEVVKPVIEMRDLIVKANSQIDYICRCHATDEGDWLEAIEGLAELHRRANLHTETVENVVRRVRDGT